MYKYISGNDLADADDGRKEEEARLPRPSDIDGVIQGELFSRCVLCAGAEVRNGLGGSGIPYLASQRSPLSESVVTRQRPRRKRSAVRRTDKEGIGLYLMYWIGWHGRIMPRARVVVTPQTRPEGGRPPEVPDNEGKGIHKIFRTSITPPGDAVCPTAR